MKLIQLGLESHWHAIQSTYSQETACRLNYGRIYSTFVFGDGWPTCPDCIRALPPREPPNYVHRLASLERIVDELVDQYREQRCLLQRAQEDFEQLSALVNLLQNAPASATGGPGSDFENEPGN